MVLLAQLASVRIQKDRKVAITWRLSLEQSKQEELAARGLQQIDAPYDIRHPLFDVVHNASQNIRIEPVFAMHDKISAVRLQTLGKQTLNPVWERNVGGNRRVPLG